MRIFKNTKSYYYCKICMKSVLCADWSNAIFITIVKFWINAILFLKRSTFLDFNPIMTKTSSSIWVSSIADLILFWKYSLHHISSWQEYHIFNLINNRKCEVKTNHNKKEQMCFLSCHAVLSLCNEHPSRRKGTGILNIYSWYDVDVK